MADDRGREGRGGAGHYEVVVEGALDERWSAWFAPSTVTARGDGRTLLSGWVPDQAALHGLLARIRDLNLTLVSLTRRDRGA